MLLFFFRLKHMPSSICTQSIVCRCVCMCMPLLAFRQSHRLACVCTRANVPFECASTVCVCMWLAICVISNIQYSYMPHMYNYVYMLCARICARKIICFFSILIHGFAILHVSLYLSVYMYTLSVCRQRIVLFSQI